MGKKIMEYHVISGKIIETRRTYMSARDGKKRKRGTRIAGNTSMRKILLNEREAVKRAARTLNANFFAGFLFVTLKFSTGRLPADYDAAKQAGADFLERARKIYRKQTGKPLRYFWVTANWSPKYQRPARLHMHLVLDPDVSMDMLAALWPEGEFYVKRVSEPGDLTGLAVYLLENVHGLEAGKKKYSTSKGLMKPIYTEPVEVEDIEGVEALPGTFVVDGEPTYNEDGRLVGSYIRAVAQEPPKVRGSMVVLPKRKKRRKKWNEEYMLEIQKQDD